MDINLLVIWFLFILISVLIAIGIRIIANYLILNKSGKTNYEVLKDNLKNEIETFEKNSQKTVLIDALNETLFNRLFQITRELLLFQKMILNNNMG